MVAAFRLLLSRGGIPALYSGLVVSVVGVMPSMAVYFALYDFLKRLGARMYPSPQGVPPSSSSFTSLAIVCVAAGLSNAFAAVLRVPSEVLKQRLQAGLDVSLKTCLSRLLWGGGSSTGGAPADTLGGRLKTLFPPGAISSQIVRDVPYAVVTLLLYEYLRAVSADPSRGVSSATGAEKNKKKKKRADDWSNNVNNLLCGAVAGGIGTIATHPLDVVKTRLQTAVGATLYKGWWDCASKSVNGEGWSVLLRGSGPRLLHKIPANGFFFLFYELFKKLLGVEG